MKATVHQLASNGAAALSKGAPASAGVGGEGRASSGAAVPRSAHSTSDMDAAVRTIVRMARLNAIAEVGVSDERINRAIARQGEILLLAGLQLMSEGGS